MYMNLKNASTSLGGFSPVYYWSSSELDVGNAWFQSFDYVDQAPYYKFYATHVRPVRAF